MEEILITKKKTRKHPTNEDLLNQIIEVITEIKSLPKRENWNHLSVVIKGKYASRNTFLRHFGTFEFAIKKALKKAEKEGKIIYYVHKNV
ncbi:MAG: hypothetical protein WCI91_01175 [Candidatus Nomurabacteria bacterium]